MIIFLDENDVEYGALATIKATNAVNGERSITGEIISGDVVLSRIERGWRLRFEDEYYVVTYAKPIDEGKNVQVSFDAVHQFFWDFGKSSVYDQLSDGSHTFRAYLEFIFNGSGYNYDIETSLMVKAFEKQSFGYKNRLSLFNDVITSSGVEFQVNGKVVRILAKVGTDLSTVVRKNFNLNELGIEKNIGDFVTYQKGFGAYFDEEDHSKGRLIAEYTSPLASIYGKLEADPLVDERYKQPESLLSALKETVDNSYTISVSLDMEDLTRAGYRYTQPVAGDYIMAINETLGFKEKIRIVSFTSEYDVTGQLIKHTVTCNDIGSVKKLSASYTQTQHQAANAEINANTAYEFANKALVSANGKNTNYYGDAFPVDNPKGTLKKGDLLFLTVGDTVKQYYWNGAEWVTNPVVSDVEAFKEQIADELKDVPNREEFENKISEELANSKAEIETQIETAKTQAESNAKEYADTINQETTKIAEQAKTAADEIKSDLVNVKSNLTSTSIVANNAQASVDEAKQDLAEVASDLSTAKQDLTSHAQQLQTQANAQTELTKRVTTVETTANGTKTTVSELTKTVSQNGKDITSVTNRTKTVEDDLANTKTTLTQVQTTANSASQKTATLETGLNGLNAKFETLKIGSRNYFKNSKSRKYYIDSTETQDVRTFIDDEFWQNDTRFTKDYVRMSFDIAFNPALPSNFTTNVHFSASPWYNCGGITFKGGTTALQHFDLKFNLSGAGDSYKTDNVFIRLNNTLPLNTAVSLENFNLYLSAVVEDYTQNEADIESKVAEYKQNADQNYASLQSNLQTLDGTVKQNKSEFDQTASQLKTSISAIEGKIPTNVSTRNLIIKSNDFANPHKQAGANTTVTSTDDYFIIKSTGYTANDWGGISWNMSISEVKAGEEFSILMPVYIDSSIVLDSGWNFNIKNHSTNSAAYSYDIPTNKKDQWFNVAITFKASKDVVFDTYPFYVRLVKNGLVRIKPPILVRGNLIPSDYQPAFEDTKSDVTKLNTTLTQTANGLEQLSTQVTSQGSTIISHTNSINSLATGLSAKVSQTDFNTLSGRVTTAENNITAKANELSSKITSVEGKIPSGEINLVEYGRPADGYSPYSDAQYTTHGFYYNSAYKMYIIKNTATSEKVFGMNRFKVERNTDYTLYFKGFNNSALTHMDVWFLKRVNGSTQEWDSAHQLVSGRKLSTSRAEDVSVTFNTGNYDEGYIRFDNNGTTTSGKEAVLFFGDVSVKKGKSNNGWSPSLAELASSQDLKTAQSEFKQTTDSIKASVQSLDNNTVKSSSLTINTDGVVIKAGKSTSDFANAVGSYFSVNQNAINLFSDKINVKGNMIVSGAITSDKIASKQINTAHLNGKIITADAISSNAVTADAIKAGAVTTDKMSANSINGDRITAGTLDAAKIKAGSISASQIASGTLTSEQIKAGAIKSINIEASAITSDKIASNSIDASKIVTNGLTANIIKGGKLQSLSNATDFELDTGKLFYNHNNTGVFRVQSGASTMGLKFTNTAITVNGSSKVLSRVILGGDRRESTLDDGKWDQGGFTGIVAETINGVASNAHDKADTLRAIGDNIYFTHSYETDALTGVSAAGWKMETYAPDTSYKGNVVLKPYGVSYRQSNIVVGDLRLDNGDGSGYWMRATINVLKACFGHIVNGGTSSDAINAIKSELNKISGT